jgi:hypothetical protein
MRRLIGIALMAGVAGVAMSQQPAAPALMGTVATEDALVSGGLEVQGSRARLLTNASVTAYTHTAEVQLDRGGSVLVCATSQFHLLHSGRETSLLFGLDRGAMEIHSASQAQDTILTPDIRFTVEAPGTFDFKMRVSRGGDTCVDNAGAGAPVLVLNDAFSGASYRLMPGQHVLFEHGNLREVVDREKSPCGCPAAEPVAVAGTAAAQHPFPEAVSAGLAAPAVVNNVAPVGETHAQISATMSNTESFDTLAAQAKAHESQASPASASAEPPKTPPGAHEIGSAIKRFFHRLFHPGSDDAAKPAS